MSIKVTPIPIKVTPSTLSKLPRLIQKWTYSFICLSLPIHNIRVIVNSLPYRDASFL